jgi:hypothetical protein
MLVASSFLFSSHHRGTRVEEDEDEEKERREREIFEIGERV